MRSRSAVNRRDGMIPISGDARLVMGTQAVRAFGYGLTSVLLGVTLDELGFSGLAAGGCSLNVDALRACSPGPEGDTP